MNLTSLEGMIQIFKFDLQPSEIIFTDFFEVILNRFLIFGFEFIIYILQLPQKNATLEKNSRVKILK